MRGRKRGVVWCGVECVYCVVLLPRGQLNKSNVIT